MRKATATAALAVLFTLSSAPAHAATIPSERVTIDVVTVNGSGCKQGSAEVIVSPDNTSFWVIYSDYLAQAGKSAGATEFRKNCQLTLQINTPQGFSYGIA
jgi:ABC-type sugar transport system substrate-binding protein